MPYQVKVGKILLKSKLSQFRLLPRTRCSRSSANWKWKNCLLEYQLSKPPAFRDNLSNYPLPDQRISGPGRRGIDLVKGESGCHSDCLRWNRHEKQAKELQSSDIIVGTPGVLLTCPSEGIELSEISHFV